MLYAGGGLQAEGKGISFAQDELPVASQTCDASPDLGEHGEPDTCLAWHWLLKITCLA